MKVYAVKSGSFANQKRLTSLSLIMFLILSIVSCTLISSDEDEANGDENALQLTEIALGVEQTMIARGETQTVLTATAGSQSTSPEAPFLPTPDMAATQAALQPTPSGLEATPSTEPLTDDIEEKLKSANILLYEDIVNNPNANRYIKGTLDMMGLTYTDVGSAKGRLKDALIIGTPNGEPWDIIIVGAESREGIQGEFFEYINDSIQRGSSVILEAFHLDEIFRGKASIILNRCGVSVENYAGKSRSTTDIMLYPVNDLSHPILNIPNNDISLTEGFTFFWAYSDLGSTMDLTGEGDGQLLLARSPNDTTRNGVLAVCSDGKLILQTFSSHSFKEGTMAKLWQNYIYYALQARLSGST